jgi:hypothetical protein
VAELAAWVHCRVEDRRSFRRLHRCKAAAMDAAELRHWLPAERKWCLLHPRCKARAADRERVEVLEIRCRVLERESCLLLHRCRERAPAEAAEGTAAP